jgi:hypothetical protein
VSPAAITRRILPALNAPLRGGAVDSTAIKIVIIKKECFWPMISGYLGAHVFV